MPPQRRISSHASDVHHTTAPAAACRIRPARLQHVSIYSKLSKLSPLPMPHHAAALHSTTTRLFPPATRRKPSQPTATRLSRLQHAESHPSPLQHASPVCSSPKVALTCLQHVPHCTPSACMQSSTADQQTSHRTPLVHSRLPTNTMPPAHSRPPSNATPTQAAHKHASPHMQEVSTVDSRLPLLICSRHPPYASWSSKPNAARAWPPLHPAAATGAVLGVEEAEEEEKMITSTDFYNVMTAVVPLYVAMILAYGSVKWWGIFTPVQCSGLNRFVALFAVPHLSFHFISSNNIYKMNLRFIVADTLQKFLVLAALAVWGRLSSRGRLDWTITIFSVSTLPNTLVMGIPLLKGMYGEGAGSLMVQIVVLQCIIYVNSDVVSLDGREVPIETETRLKEDGKLHVTVRGSNASRFDLNYPRRSVGGFSAATPRPSNLTNAEIYSLQSSRDPTPRGFSFSHNDFYAMVGGRSSNFGAVMPRPSNYDESEIATKPPTRLQYQLPVTAPYPMPNPAVLAPAPKRAANGQPNVIRTEDAGNKDLHMFVWSSSASPVSEVFGNGKDFGLPAAAEHQVTVGVSPAKLDSQDAERQSVCRAPNWTDRALSCSHSILPTTDRQKIIPPG